MGIEELLNERAEKRGLEKGFKQGMEKAEKQNKTAFVKSLLLNTDFDNAKIAFLAGVEQSFVEEIKLELSK